MPEKYNVDSSLIWKPEPKEKTTEELIKYLISIIGGILATIILNLLRKKFPEWFKSKK